MKIKLCEHGDVFILSDKLDILWSPYDPMVAGEFLNQKGYLLQVEDMDNGLYTLSTWAKQIQVAQRDGNRQREEEVRHE